MLPCLYTDDEALKALREAGASVLFVGSEALGQGTAIDEKADVSATPSLSDDEMLLAAAVYAYAVAVLKCCRVFYKLVKAGDIYEDEEFCDYERYPGGRRGPRLRLVLGDDVEDADLVQLCDRVLKALQDKIKADGSASTDMLAWRALHCRIDHRRSYFSTIAMLRPLGECLKPETKDKHGSVVDTTQRVRDLVALQLQRAKSQMTKAREAGERVAATIADVWRVVSDEDAAEAERAEAEAKAAEEKKLESDRPLGVEGACTIDSELVLELASITKTGKMRYGIDQDSVKEFLPAGPPRKMTELVVPSKAYQIMDEHLSHLEFVCSCQDRVISCVDFEACQVLPDNQRAQPKSTKPRSTTTLTQMHDYLEDFVDRRADLFSRSLMAVLISGPLTRATAPAIPHQDKAVNEDLGEAASKAPRSCPHSPSAAVGRGHSE